MDNSEDFHRPQPPLPNLSQQKWVAPPQQVPPSGPASSTKNKAHAKPWAAENNRNTKNMYPRPVIHDEVQKRKSKSSKGSWRWLIFKLLLAYTGFLLLFKCPLGSELTEDSPAFCKPLHLRANAFQPHWDLHVAPHFEHPYAVKAADLYKSYIQPPSQRALGAAQDLYNNKVHPQVEHHVNFAYTVLDERTKQYREPFLPHWHRARTQSQQAYDKAQEVSGPILAKAKLHYGQHMQPLLDHASAFSSKHGRILWTVLEQKFHKYVWVHVLEVYDSTFKPQIDKIWERMQFHSSRISDDSEPGIEHQIEPEIDSGVAGTYGGEPLETSTPAATIEEIVPEVKETPADETVVEEIVIEEPEVVENAEDSEEVFETVDGESAFETVFSDETFGEEKTALTTATETTETPVPTQTEEIPEFEVDLTAESASIATPEPESEPSADSIDVEDSISETEDEVDEEILAALADIDEVDLDEVDLNEIDLDEVDLNDVSTEDEEFEGTETVYVTSVITQRVSTATIQSQATEEPAPEQIQNESTTSQKSTGPKDWASKVSRMVDSAIVDFQNDLNKRLEQLIADARPDFMHILRKLSATGEKHAGELITLVTEIENQTQEGQDLPESLSIESVLKEFQTRNDVVFEITQEVRARAEALAEDAVQVVAAERELTANAVEDFFDVVLLEAGRETANAKGDDAAEWAAWKSYSQLKDQLKTHRERVFACEVNMDVVNTALQEAQKASQLLSEEYSKHIQGLRGKTQFLMQQHLILKHKRAAEEGQVKETVEDAEYFEINENGEEVPLKPAAKEVQRDIPVVQHADL